MDDNNKIGERLARTLAGLALIQRTLKGDKPPIEKKIVCKVSMSKMIDGGDPEINMLVIPVIMGYITDIVSEKEVLDLIDNMFAFGDGELQKVTDEANEFLDKKDAVLKLYKEGGMHINEEDIKK
jgi:hypothetical protein